MIYKLLLGCYFITSWATPLISHPVNPNKSCRGVMMEVQESVSITNICTQRCEHAEMKSCPLSQGFLWPSFSLFALNCHLGEIPLRSFMMYLAGYITSTPIIEIILHLHNRGWLRGISNTLSPWQYKLTCFFSPSIS